MRGDILIFCQMTGKSRGNMFLKKLQITLQNTVFFSGFSSSNRLNKGGTMNGAHKPVHCIFSSPEHEVLMVSYCDQSMSVVRRPSFVVNNLF